MTQPESSLPATSLPPSLASCPSGPGKDYRGHGAHLSGKGTAHVTPPGAPESRGFRGSLPWRSRLRGAARPLPQEEPQP